MQLRLNLVCPTALSVVLREGPLYLVRPPGLQSFSADTIVAMPDMVMTYSRNISSGWRYRSGVRHCLSSDDHWAVVGFAGVLNPVSSSGALTKPILPCMAAIHWPYAIKPSPNSSANPTSPIPLMNLHAIPIARPFRTLGTLVRAGVPARRADPPWRLIRGVYHRGVVRCSRFSRLRSCQLLDSLRIGVAVQKLEST